MTFSVKFKKFVQGTNFYVWLGLSFCLLLALGMTGIGLLFLSIEPPIGWMVLAAVVLYLWLLYINWAANFNTSEEIQ